MPQAAQKYQEMEEYRLANDRLSAVVQAQGAQLVSLRHADYGEMLWGAEAAWPQHAPNLFPIVGQLAGDALHHAGASYPLTRHGFARRSRFTWLDHSSGRCGLQLSDDARTHTMYPFAFRLEICYTLGDETLEVRYTLANPAQTVLPASIGAHPAFRWPLVAGIPKADHTLRFEQAEPEPIRRLQDGLLQLETFPTPIEGRVLELEEALFEADAIVMDRIASRSVRYSAPGAPEIEVSWDESFAQLGLWSKPGADFLCIEPWHGYASPVGFDGEFTTKPGLLLIAPGASQTLIMRIRVGAGQRAIT